MSAEILPTIQTLIADREQQLREARESGRMINRLCKRVGDTPMFPQDETESNNGGSIMIKRAEFVGAKLASAIRTYLERRGKDVHGPATSDEIFRALKEGGFQFETSDDRAELHRLKTSLGKNTTTFLRVAAGEHDVYGLIEWWPDMKPKAKEETKPEAATAAATDSTKACDPPLVEVVTTKSPKRVKLNPAAAAADVPEPAK